VDISTPLGTYRNLRPLPGEHQRANLLVAVRLLEEAAAAGVRVDWTTLSEATTATRWAGRLQEIDGSPRLLLDGAHNAAGAEALATHLRSAPPFVLLFGVMSDKGIDAMARELFPLAREVVLTRPREGRAAAPDDIARRGASFCSRLHQTADVATGLDLARSLAGPEGLVVVAGSLYLVGEVLELVGEAPQGRPRSD
jgi:dihydrofolate synthase/folylpolyglutamate synthase